MAPLLLVGQRREFPLVARAAHHHHCHHSASPLPPPSSSVRAVPLPLALAQRPLLPWPARPPIQICAPAARKKLARHLGSHWAGRRRRRRPLPWSTGARPTTGTVSPPPLLLSIPPSRPPGFAEPQLLALLAPSRLDETKRGPAQLLLLTLVLLLRLLLLLLIHVAHRPRLSRILCRRRWRARAAASWARAGPSRKRSSSNC